MRWREHGLRLIAAASTSAIAAHGQLTVPGLRAGASITRDERGIAWVEAEHETDLYFAAGFAQASDRLWQMDIARRRAHGRLSELFGAATLDQDIQARSLGLARVARRSLPELSPQCHANLISFSAGVNAVIRRMRRRIGLPPEFLLLRYRPEPWSPLDSIAIVKQLGFDLAGNLRTEVFRMRLAREQPAWAAQFSEPRYPAGGPVMVRGPAAGTGAGHPRPTGFRATAVTGVALPAAMPSWLSGRNGEGSSGSNAWVISGEHTASGAPLLANDPHVLFTQPSQWYQVGLRLGGDAACGYGVTVPGIPGIIVGANRHLAWAITDATVDTQDLCLLPEGDLPGQWRAVETIVVRGAAPVPVTVAGGERHIELSPPALRDNEPRRALFWSGLLPSGEIESSQRLWRCTCYPEFREALRCFGVPVLNVLVACRNGDIGLKTVGHVPRRIPGSGRAPGSFAQVAASWEQFLTFAELPEVRNPPEGYLVAANHQLIAEGGPLDLGADWVAPYRAERIEQLVTSSAPVTAEAAACWQSDTVNGRARRVLPTILAALAEAPPAQPPAATGYALLRDWDGRDDGAQAAPLVFFQLMEALAEQWVTSRLGADLAGAMPDLTLQVDHLVLSAAARAALGDRDPLSLVLGRALVRACARIVDELGTELARWRYDAIHRIVDQHPLARAVAGAAALFGSPATPVGGSGHSVCLMTPNQRGEAVEGAPWRFVAELTPTGPRLRDVLRHGSSGHPCSPHYDDQTAAHSQGEHYTVSLDGPGPSQPGLALVPARRAPRSVPPWAAVRRPGRRPS
jgi:penicillin G amidase